MAELSTGLVIEVWNRKNPASAQARGIFLLLLHYFFFTSFSLQNLSIYLKRARSKIFCAAIWLRPIAATETSSTLK